MKRKNAKRRMKTKTPLSHKDYETMIQENKSLKAMNEKLLKEIIRLNKKR